MKANFCLNFLQRDEVWYKFTKMWDFIKCGNMVDRVRQRPTFVVKIVYIKNLLQTGKYFYLTVRIFRFFLWFDTLFLFSLLIVFSYYLMQEKVFISQWKNGLLFLKIVNYCADFFLKVSKWLAIHYTVFWKTLISREAHVEKVLVLEPFQPFFSKTELTLIHINKLCPDHISELGPKSLEMEEMLPVFLHLFNNLGF